MFARQDMHSGAWWMLSRARQSESYWLQGEPGVSGVSKRRKSPRNSKLTLARILYISVDDLEVIHFCAFVGADGHPLRILGRFLSSFGRRVDLDDLGLWISFLQVSSTLTERL